MGAFMESTALIERRVLLFILVFSSFQHCYCSEEFESEKHVEQQLPLPPSEGHRHDMQMAQVQNSRSGLRGHSHDHQEFARKLLKLHERYCGRSRICLGSASSSSSHCYSCAPCMCDLGCYDYGDCCPDVALEAFDSSTLPRPFTGSDTDRLKCVNTAFMLESVVNSPYYGSQYGPEYSRQGLFVQKDRTRSYTDSFYMISRCPQSFTEDATSCEDDANTEPPVTADVDNTTYKNVHCARCHGIYEYKTWDIHISCGSRQNLTFAESPYRAVAIAIDEPDCSVFYIPPLELDIRKCYSAPEMVTTCNITGQWTQKEPFIERACQVYTTVKEVDGVLYKNVFCYLCNHGNDMALTSPKCRPKPWIQHSKLETSLSYHAVAAGMFNEDPGGGLDHKRCDGRSVYDHTEGRCRDVECTRSYHLVSGTCQPLFRSARGIGYELYFALKSDQVIDISDDNSVLHDIQDDLEKFTNKTLLKGNFNFQYFAMAFNHTGPKGPCSPKATPIGVYARVVSRDSRSQKDIEKTLTDIRNTNFSFVTRNLNLTFQTYPSELPWHVMHPSRRQSSLTQVHCIFVVRNDHLEQKKGGLRVVGTTTPDPTIPIPPPFVRLSCIAHCPQVQLSPQEYTASGPGDDLHLAWTDEPLPPNRFVMDLDGNVTICLSDFLTKFEGRRISAEVILSYVLFPISIFLLLLCLLAYAVFAALRTLPGRNNMLFLTALILSQTMLLAGYCVDNFSHYCAALGVLAHYFTLAAHCALMVCSYHVYTIFTTMHLAENIPRENRAFLLYIVFTLCVPLGVVSLVMIIYATSASSQTIIGYGSSAVCLLTTTTAVWIVVFLPTLVTISVNIALFCRTCTTLRQNKDIETNATDERHVHFYFRSSLMMFFTWIVYVIAAATRLPELRIVFIVCQFLLGVYIFFVLVLNQRIFGLLYSLLCEGGQSKKDELEMKMDSVGPGSSGDSSVVVTGFRRTTSIQDHKPLSGNSHINAGAKLEDTTT